MDEIGRGWALMGGDRGKRHFFGKDGRSLCGKWAELSRNILERHIHSDLQCAACRHKYARLVTKFETALAETNGDRGGP